MPISRMRLTTGYLATFTSVLVLASQVVLAVTFDYPEITSQPALTVLQRYHAAGPMVPLAWLAFACGTLLLLPVARLFESLLEQNPTAGLRIATGFGIIAALAYTVGIMRWVLVARLLSDEVAMARSATEAGWAALAFRTVDVYCGHSFGETIAPIAHGVWATILGHRLLVGNWVPRWMAWTQIVAGAAIALRPLEYVGSSALGKAGDIAVGVWTVLLAITGVIVVSQRPNTNRCAAKGYVLSN